jgi:hypothetical protein
MNSLRQAGGVAHGYRNPGICTGTKYLFTRQLVNSLTLLTLLLFTGCTDWLDIKPLDKMVVEDYWKTENDVEASVLACYAAMTDVDDTYKQCAFLERIIASGEVRSDNIIEGGSDPGAEMRAVLKMTIEPNNDLAKWESFYKVINYCNLVLKNAPDVAKIDPNYTEGKLHVHLAEAYALRALTYFYLVRIYKDVPYIRDPYMDDNEDFSIPKTDGETILEDMVKDLIIAEDYAVVTRGWSGGIMVINGTIMLDGLGSTKCRITKNAVRALLADICLWQASGLKGNPALQIQKYEDCIRACERIEPDILTGFEDIFTSDFTGAELMLFSNEEADYSSFAFVFAENYSMESIFELNFDDVSLTKSLTNLYGRDGRAGNLSAAAKEEWISEQDVRKKYAYAPEKGSIHRILKYVLSEFSNGVEMSPEPPLISEGIYPNWIFYRVADVYLMKAEALAELGGEINLRAALELVNKVYLRSNPKQLDLEYNKYKDRMRWLVLEERQREFMFEGKRWFDLLRLWRRDGPTTAVLNLMLRKYKGDTEMIRSKLSIEDALYMPVHKDELINNQELKQNTFYENIINR